jgi:hypothetical protein
MADFVLGRLKFTFLGPWVTGYAYIKDDVVSVGGSSYVCMTNHTSAGTFALDSSNWDVMVDGQRWRGEWATTTSYEVNDIVKYNNTIYLCTTAHISTGSFNAIKFDIYFQLSGIIDAGSIV